MDSIKACLAQCFGSDGKAPSSTPGDPKYVNKLRKKLNKPDPKSRHKPIELITTPGAAFGPSTRVPPPPPLPVRPVVGSKASGPTDVLSREDLRHLFNEINRTLDGVPYAICGLTCLIDHGFTGRTAKTATVLVPAESKDVIRSWAVAHGGRLPAHKRDQFQVRLPHDRSVRSARVKYLDTGFDRLSRVQSSMSDAIILSFSSQLDQVASAWVRECRGGRPPLQQLRDPQKARHIQTIVADLFWCLQHAVERGIRLDEAFLPTFLSAEFWGPLGAFLGETRTQEAMRLVVRAGVPLGDHLQAHEDARRRRSDVRQHNELLRAYGMVGANDDDEDDGVVAEQPGPFVAMRSPGRNDIPSVYTLKSKDSNAEMDGAGPAAGRGPLKAPPGRSKLSIQERASSDSPRGSGHDHSGSVEPKKTHKRAQASVDLVQGKNTPKSWL